MLEPALLQGAPRFRCFVPASAPASATSRVIHFVRHGEALQQVRRAEAERAGAPCRCHELAPSDPARRACPYRDPSLIDAPLTDRGRAQVRGKGAGIGAEIVLASTLSRSLETARLAFEGATPAVSIIALESLRPKIGMHMHSKRSPLRTLRARFPEVDFSDVASDADTLWTAADESRLSLDLRAARFLRTLAGRRERQIALVTHFTVLFTLFSGAAETLLVGRNEHRPPDDPPWIDASACEARSPLRDFLAPGEVRTFALIPR